MQPDPTSLDRLAFQIAQLGGGPRPDLAGSPFKDIDGAVEEFRRLDEAADDLCSEQEPCPHVALDLAQTLLVEIVGLHRALAEAQRERASVIATGELMLAECREQRDAARADAEKLAAEARELRTAWIAMRPVVEAATKLTHAREARDADVTRESIALVALAGIDLDAAVDTYETQEGTDAQA